MSEQPTYIPPITTNIPASTATESNDVYSNAARSVFEAIVQMEKAEEPSRLFEIIDQVMAAVPCTCAIFDIGEGFLRLEDLVDKSPANKISTHKGATIDVARSPSIFSTQESFFIDLQHRYDHFEHLFAFFNRLGNPSISVFPIMVSGEPIKLLVVSHGPSSSGDSFLDSMKCLASIVGLSLERIQQKKATQTRLENLELLSQLSQSIAIETDFSVLYRLIHRKITSRLGDDLSFAVAIYQPEQKTIEIPYMFENGTLSSIEPFPLGEGLTSHLINTKKSLLLVANIEQEAQRLGAKVVGKIAKSWLGVPLVINGQVLGAIIVQDLANEGRFSETDRSLLETLAPQLAVAIGNTQLLEQMNITLHKYDQEQFLLNSLLANIPEKIYFKNEVGQYIRASRSWLSELPDLPTTEIYGKTEFELFPGEAGSASHHREMDVIATSQPIIGEIEAKMGENVEQSWDWRSRIPLVNEAGVPVGLLGISQNITDLKKTEILAGQRAQQLQTASEIARATTGSLDTTQILKNAVNLIRDRFAFYHSSVFLIDASQQYAVLQEASGKAGEMMKKIGHRLNVGSPSLVGQATAKAETVVVNNVHSHNNYYPNPLLPETRSEVVIPLKIGSRVLGALDVQSDKINAFSPDDIHIIEILADQLAIALENANLYSKTQDQIAKQKLLRQLTTAASTANDLDEALHKIVASLHETVANSKAAIYFASGVNSLEIRAFAGYETNEAPKQSITFKEGIIGMAARQRLPILMTDPSSELAKNYEDANTRSALAAPIIYLDNLLGVLSLESPHSFAYDQNDQELIGSLGDSIGVIIANIRLLLQIRKQMDLQGKVFDISSKIRRSIDIDSILRTTAQEIGQTLGFSEVTIQLASPDGHDSPVIDGEAE